MAFKMKKSPIKDMSELRARQRRMSRGESEFQYRNRMRRKASAEAKVNAVSLDTKFKPSALSPTAGTDRINKTLDLKKTNLYDPNAKPAKKTFKQAFADARKAGKKTFIFEGNRYTTKLKKSKNDSLVFGDKGFDATTDFSDPNKVVPNNLISARYGKHGLSAVIEPVPPFRMKGMTFKGKSPVRNDKNVLIAENTENTAVTGGTTEFGKKDFSKHPSVKKLINAGAPKNVIETQIKKLKNKAKKNI